MLTTRPFRFGILICITTLTWQQRALALELEFNPVRIEPMSRIDAIACLGKGVVVAGSRGTNAPGNIHVSKDYGATWHTVGNVTGTNFITCLSSGGKGLGYLLTGRKVHVWKTTDYGETWTDLGQVCNATNRSGFANAYGMLVTPKGTVLVADSDSKGGHIHRSTDQGRSWQDMGRISPRPLYRLNAIKNGVIVNGWAGNIYKSTDDGVTWVDMGNVSKSPLYAIEYLENNGTVLVATEDSHVFRSKDQCKTWQDVGKVGDAADDFAWLGAGRVLYSTYTGDRSLYLSEDSGVSWKKIGAVPTEANDWLDHFICVYNDRVRRVVGGTSKGYIVHAQVRRGAPTGRAVAPSRQGGYRSAMSQP